MLPNLPNSHSVTNESIALYLKDISMHKVLNVQEEYKVALRSLKGDRSAFEKLIKCNLRFVVSVCRNYQNQGLPLSDLINEGNIGLIRAAKSFNPRKNYKFITYAVWWIRQAILRALAEQSRIIKLPLNRVGTLYKIGKARNNLEQQFFRSPIPEEIAEELKINKEEVQEALQIGNSHMSIDLTVSQDHEENSQLSDRLHSNGEFSSNEKASKNLLQGEIEEILCNLSKREKKIIELYFGIGEETSFTLEEIGKHFHLTRERIRQIKDRALKKLKNSMAISRLKAFLQMTS